MTLKNIKDQKGIVFVGIIIAVVVVLVTGAAGTKFYKSRIKHGLEEGRPQVPQAPEDGKDPDPAGTEDREQKQKSPSGNPKEAALLFSSGFDNSTRIDFKNNQYLLAGKDMTSGYSWDDDFPAEKVWFEYLIGKSSPDIYVTTEIQDGVLYQEVKGDWPNDGVLTRNAYNIRPRPEMKQAYIRYRMKFQDDFLSVWPDSNAWRIVMEWKEPDTSGDGKSHYRFNLQIRNNPQGVPSWLLQGQVVEPVRKDDWYATENIPVPIGEWFDLEVFWRYGNESTGRVWAKVNGTLVADHKGRTQHPDDPLGIDYWAIFKNYADVPDWGGTTKQWIDDVEIWSDEPEETTPRSCYYQKVICITTPCEPQLVCPAS